MSHLLRAEMQRLRPGGWLDGRPDSQLPWTPQTDWSADLGADSLELMQLLTALSEWAGIADDELLDQLWRDGRLGTWCQVLQRSLAQDATTVCFRTSGSTGEPQACPHRLALLWQEMGCMAQAWSDLALMPPQRIVSTVPAHHIYGFLFTVLLPHAWGTARGGVLPVLDAWQQPPARVRSALRPGDVLVSVPALWALLARSPGAWPAGVVGITSTAPCPDKLAATLGAPGALQALLQIYGSSETAGLGWRCWPEQSYRLHGFWQLQPAPLAAPADADMPEVTWLRREGLPAAVAAPDVLHWSGPRRFEPRARHDRVVQVAGHNVQPAQVEAALCDQPGVKAAAVRLTGAEPEARLKAFVVPATPADAKTLVQRLHAWCRLHLPPAARPVHIQTGAALPVNPLGKRCDWRLPEAAAPQDGQVAEQVTQELT